MENKLNLYVLVGEDDGDEDCNGDNTEEVIIESDSEEEMEHWQWILELIKNVLFINSEVDLFNLPTISINSTCTKEWIILLWKKEGIIWFWKEKKNSISSMAEQNTTDALGIDDKKSQGKFY